MLENIYIYIYTGSFDPVTSSDPQILKKKKGKKNTGGFSEEKKRDALFVCLVNFSRVKFPNQERGEKGTTGGPCLPLFGGFKKNALET